MPVLFLSTTNKTDNNTWGSSSLGAVMFHHKLDAICSKLFFFEAVLWPDSSILEGESERFVFLEKIWRKKYTAFLFLLWSTCVQKLRQFEFLALAIKISFLFDFCTDVLLTGSISKCYHNENYVTCNNNSIKLTYRTWTSLESRNLPFSIQFPCWEMQLFQILRRNYIVTNVVFASISHTMSQLGIHSFRAIM